MENYYQIHKKNYEVGKEYQLFRFNGDESDQT